MTRHFLLAALLRRRPRACQSTPAPEPAAAAACRHARARRAAAHRRRRIGDFGLDLTAGKPDVKAGRRLLRPRERHVVRHLPIPEDRSSYGIFTHARRAVPAAACARSSSRRPPRSRPPGSPEQKIGDYYASFMDTAAIEANGPRSRSRPSSIASPPRRRSKDIATLFGAPGFQSTFGVGLPPDLKNPERLYRGASARAASGCRIATTTSRTIRS